MSSTGGSSSPVCMGKHSANCGCTTAVVGGSGSRRSWQEVTARNTREKKPWDLEAKGVNGKWDTIVVPLRRQELIQALLAKCIGRAT